MPGPGPTSPGPDDAILAVTLDANIIYPMALCDYLLWVAQRSVFRPGWSRPILDEAERNLVAKGTPNAPRRMQRMREAFEDADPGKAAIGREMKKVPTTVCDCCLRPASVYDTAMDLSILYKNRVIAVAKTEQGLAWLIEHGPVVADPPLPIWMLKALVTDRRILRLRRGLFLAPTREGRLPSFPAMINAVDPAGYITGHGALNIHGLNDQDVSHWWSITSRRQSDIRYGPYRAHFTLSPVQARQGRRTSLQVDGEPVTLATVTQAFVDELRFMPYGLDWIETARVLRNALETHKTDEHEVVGLLGPRPSIAVARRAGLLFELVRSEPNPELLSIARKNDDITRLAGATVTDKTWRLTLPFPRERILRAIR